MLKISDALIIEVIDKGLSSLGERPKTALWFCLEKDLNIYRKDVPQHVETFQNALQGFFGLGYKFLEALFLKYLGDAIGEDLSGSGSFAECIDRLRKLQGIGPAEFVISPNETTQITLKQKDS